MIHSFTRECSKYCKKLIYNIFSQSCEFAALSGWRILVSIACKQQRYGITICDITKSEDVERNKTFQDIEEALTIIQDQAPKIFTRIKRNIKYIARADIPDPFHYYSSMGLCLVKHNISNQSNSNLFSDNILATNIYNAGNFAFLSHLNINISENADKVEYLLQKFKLSSINRYQSLKNKSPV
jgi:hypothetical protein